MKESDIQEIAKRSEWNLRFTDSKGGQPTLALVRHGPSLNALRAVLGYYGKLDGLSSTRRAILPSVAQIISRVQSEQQISLELHRYLVPDRSGWRGDLPLDDEAAYKVGLIFILQKGIRESNRAELLARRVERMTREEAGYLLSRLREYGKDSGRWAETGLRIMLAGRARDVGVDRMLQDLRKYW